jgi:hypothetical protein
VGNEPRRKRAPVGRRRRPAARAPDSLREQLAQEAARLMVEGGIEDFGLAKRKAAERLGVRAAGALPTNAQIEASVAERQRIFEPQDHGLRLRGLRRSAAAVMLRLEAFAPRLVGPVLAGTATVTSAIELHAFADAPELVAAAIEREWSAVRDCLGRFRLDADTTAQVPGFRFVHDGAPVEVFVFAERAAHHAPLSPVDRRPMRRATRAAVLALLEPSAS